MTKTTTLLAVLMMIFGTTLGAIAFFDPVDREEGNMEIAVGGASTEEGYLDSLTVIFSKVRVHQDDGWTETILDDTPVDLMELEEQGSATIANLTLDEGDYDKVELHVDAVKAMLDDEEVEVFVPSGKLKVVGGFSVDSDTTATFEFDVRLVKRGNQDKYNVVPVIGKRVGPDKDYDRGKGDGHDDDDGKGSSNKAKVKLALGKAKNDISAFDHLNVTFYKARVHQAYTENNTTTYNWTEVELDDVTVDLTNLSATNETIVGNLTLDAGNYTKVELYVSTAVGIVDGDEVEVFVPSGKLKIVGDFDLEDNETASFTFDIDVVQRGKRAVYNLLPVIAKNQGDEDDD
jgi:predicted transcriptional regulator